MKYLTNDLKMQLEILKDIEKKRSDCEKLKKSKLYNEDFGNEEVTKEINRHIEKINKAVDKEMGKLYRELDAIVYHLRNTH